jgi:hypothetical protein
MFENVLFKSIKVVMTEILLLADLWNLSPRISRKKYYYQHYFLFILSCVAV